ncbi:hypothetical protein TrVE_jg6481 [Triparma verrucosa]|uniref:Centrosomal protein POC5 n=1 Tax=Triparma verrucosa TaxID=1606542 RepID=A0A9W7B2W8_9STRA|nr:hypothetical protein TrVE_jg6481 [Triparma verrucosa]|mmetsp:Transcript_8750/g.15881  ORF Transcript_8750/g.15881 Transcript_8750/m.15881 type:complete len:279 (+) Transcript_8750:44-880(+)
MSYNYDDSDEDDIVVGKGSLLTISGDAGETDAAGQGDSDAETMAATLNDAFGGVMRASIEKFVDIKLRLMKEHETVCNDKDTMYTTKIKKMQAVIDGLSDDLEKERALTAKLQEEKIISAGHAATAHCKRMMMRGGGISLASCVKLWGKYSKEKKAERKMDGIAQKWAKKNGLAKCFQLWSRAANELRKERESAMHDAKLETVTREIITRYESELEKMRTGLKEAHVEIARGHVQRQQLEEKMRRTFLKGMTAMNMEALELFNKAAQSDASFMQEATP